LENEKIDVLIENLSKRNIDGFYFNDFKDARQKILEMIPVDSTVGIGNYDHIIPPCFKYKVS